MAIPAGVILIWGGTNATIPTGWERETTLDGKYPKAWGDSVAPNETGGSNTHTHTGGHTHTLSAHTHTCSYGASDSHSFDDNSGSAADAHTHSNSNISTTAGGELQSNGTWLSVNQEPPYHTVIFIKPSAAASAVSSGIISHYNGSSAPIGWNFCNGSNLTPDLRNKYLKGAATGGDSGTTGGGTTHVHTVTHGHTASPHTHSGTTGAYSGAGKGGGGSGNYRANNSHTHTVNLAATTDTVSNYTKTDAGGDTVEVAYKKLGTIQATNSRLHKGIVGLWLGATDSIPTNWALCNGSNGTLDLRDKFVKIGTDLSENDDTGGANTHTHTAISHSHTTTGTHTHTGSIVAASDNYQIYGGSQGVVVPNHTHSVSVGTGSCAYSTDNMTADTVSNQPAYTTVAYIELLKVDTGASLIFNLI